MTEPGDDPYEHLTPEEQAELDALLAAGTGEKVWEPLPGPQFAGFNTEADILGYGGAAGGGKTDLACGLTLEHEKVAIFRQNGTELSGIIDRFGELLGTRKGYSGGQDKHWRFTSPNTGRHVKVEFGAFPNPGDERKYQGRPHDLLVFDEAANMRRQAVMFLLGWLRSASGRRCRALMCFNPPTTVEGRWIIDYFGPWLDKKHPRPAVPGELRWYLTGEDGKEREVDGPGPYQIGSLWIRAQSRTFIPSRVSDNPYLDGTNYKTQLMQLPEPLRSQMLHGDFHAGVTDDPWQAIPTAWVEEAMARWKRPQKLPEMDGIGMDVALSKRGYGKDRTVIARRHGMWFDEPIVYPNDQCRDGSQVAGYAVAAVRDRAPIHIDLFGVGAEPYGHLRAMHIQVIGCSVGEPARGVAKDGRLSFKNWRSELVWRWREALSPRAAEKSGIALPPNRELLNELCAFRWKLVGNSIQVSSRDELVDLLGHSPDLAMAYVLALIDTPKQHLARALLGGRLREGKNAVPDPYAGI